jgi:hypothetical protein
LLWMSAFPHCHCPQLADSHTDLCFHKAT